MRHCLIAALLAVPALAAAQSPGEVRMFDTMEAFCAQAVFVDRIKGAPPVVVGEAEHRLPPEDQGPIGVLPDERQP